MKNTSSSKTSKPNIIIKTKAPHEQKDEQIKAQYTTLVVRGKRDKETSRKEINSNSCRMLDNREEETDVTKELKENVQKWK